VIAGGSRLVAARGRLVSDDGGLRPDAAGGGLAIAAALGPRSAGARVPVSILARVASNDGVGLVLIVDEAIVDGPHRLGGILLRRFV
jgi:hypothetical protein